MLRFNFSQGRSKINLAEGGIANQQMGQAEIGKNCKILWTGLEEPAKY